MLRDSGGHRTKLTVRKFDDLDHYLDWLCGLRKPLEEVPIVGNIFLDEGIGALLALAIGDAETAFSNANARLGVGDGGLTALTGTLTFTNGSAAVTGTSTLFTSELAAGDWVQLDADGELYRVESITSDTAMTLERLYAGTGGTGAGSAISPLETGLKGANTLYKAMETGYPQRSGTTVTFRSVFGDTEANFQWLEFTVDNGAAAGKNWNRKVQDAGTKSGGTWTLDLQITLQ
ncbi:MAG TPA: hypothetical protein ENK19_10055 [Acidobacteria bacterium]|nr:hypothetical protein [Acidobacteriota bacterium]